MRKIVTMQHSFSLLESPKALEILATLAKNRGQLRITEIMEIVGGSARTSSVRVEELRNAGLINDKKDKSFPFNRYISLTKEGKMIARRLLEIEGVLQGKSGAKMGEFFSKTDRINLPNTPGVVIVKGKKTAAKRKKKSRSKG
jgi:DNA-binding transcriptional ArsR family regulator